MSEQSSNILDIAELWGRPMQAAHCPQCGVAHLLPVVEEAVTCPACFAATLEPQPTLLRPEPPELVVEPGLTPAQVGEAFTKWLGGLWLRPTDLQPRALISRLTQVYLPLWLVDSGVGGSWSAQMGYDYQVASSQEHYRGGQWTTREVTETRIRWEPRVGQIQRTYQNLSVPALAEHDRLMVGLGPFDQGAAQAYAPERVGDAAVRVPSLLPDEAWPAAQAGLDRLVAADCQAAADAQHVEQYAIQADYRDRHWTQLLLPAYATFYRDDEGRVIPVFVNGQTGRVYGLKRASQRRGWQWTGVLVGAALLCFLVGMVLAVAAVLAPPLLAGTLALLVASLLLGVAAPVPAVWAWQFNRGR
ncbi:MAG: hypothetical protein KKA73_29655 [Chloroflexi bacterium]|nr:hypothetical protein [Chloroflexota bacterium]MBU1751864.1 hypothetical protein [Chloroflexota bacterium]